MNKCHFCSTLLIYHMLIGVAYFIKKTKKNVSLLLKSICAHFGENEDFSHLQQHNNDTNYYKLKCKRAQKTLFIHTSHEIFRCSGYQTMFNPIQLVLIYIKYETVSAKIIRT